MASRLVLDTSVLMDALFAHRERHLLAVRLAKHVHASATTAVVPAHAYFELVSAIQCEKKNLDRALPLGSFGKDFPVTLEVVPVDLPFVERYLISGLTTGDLIDLKSGDMIFVALALHDQLPLVTEDAKMISVAKRHGVTAHSASEYLAAHA